MQPNYQNRGAAVQERPDSIPKKNSDPRNQQSGYQDIDKLTQLVLDLDMKAKMSSMCKAMIRFGISFNRVPNEQKQKEPPANGKQKNNFAGTAKKKNRKDNVTQRSFVAVEEKDSISETNENIQPEFGGVATVIKAQKHLSPRSITAHPHLAGMKRQDFNHIQQIRES